MPNVQPIDSTGSHKAAEGRARAPMPGLQAREPSENDLVDWALLRDWAGLILRAPRRRPRLASGVLLLTIALAAGSLWALPRRWRVECTILAARNLVMPALGNPRRAVPLAADAPTRGAEQVILGRDNLVALVRQTDLIESWRRTRAPLFALKDRVLEAISPPDDQDRLDAAVAVLEKRLTVKTDEQTVSIAIDWPDPQSAFTVVDLARQNFLESRHADEVSAIAETISILQSHAAEVGAEVNALLGRFQSQRRPAARFLPRPATEGLTAPRSAVGSPAKEDLARIEALLLAKRSARSELEQFRARRTAELQTLLAEQRASFAPAHPQVIATERSIEALRRDSAQVVALKQEEQALEDEYRAYAGRPLGERVDPQVAPMWSATPPVAAPAASEDPATDYARARFQMKVEEHHDLLARIDAARIELDTARAAFKYRYRVVKPAMVPRRPESPTLPIALLLGFIVGVFAAFGVTAAVDLWRGRVVEPWQVERATGIPVLGRSGGAGAAPSEGDTT